MRYFALKYLFVTYFFILFLTPNLFGQEEDKSIRTSGITNYSNQNGYLNFSFTTDLPRLKKKIVAGQEYFEISLSGLQHSQVVGSPEVPISTELIDLTNIEVVSISISNIISKRIYPGSKGFSGQMFPKQPGLTKNQDPQTSRKLEINHAIYRSDKPTVSDTVTIKPLGIIRGQELALIEINPLFYYPASNYFDIITSMDIRVSVRSVPGKSTMIPEITINSAKGLIDKGLIDYNEKDVTPSFSLVPSRLIVLSDTLMRRELQPLVEWKRIKGFDVIELYIGENGLDRTYSSIKDTLNYIWNNSTQDTPAPDFMIIAGDLNIVPKSEGPSGLSDLYYSEFDGNGDYLPDMFTGRLPAKDTVQMASIVEKIIQYEKFEFGDTIDHFEEAMLVAGWDNGGHIQEMNGQLSYGSDYLANTPGLTEYKFLNENNDSIRNVRYDSVMALFDRGVGFINYTGHGSQTSWLYTGIDYSMVNGLTNEGRYPIIISNACETAAFNNSNNFGSTFVRAQKKGALAFIGCTVDSYWDEDFWWAAGLSSISASPDYESSGLGFYDRLFHTHGEEPSDWFTTLGQIIYAGNLAVLSSSSSLKKYYWEYYHLLGDPSITPYIGTPGEFDISVPDSIPSTFKSISFNTIPFSYAALSHFDTLWDATGVAPSGAVTLSIPDITKDSCLLIVTGQNMKPFFKTLYFNTPDTAWLNIIDINPDDESGNGNGIADYTETIGFDIDIQNGGEQSANDVYMLISSDNKYITIINDSVSIGTVSQLSELNLSNLFEVLISDSIPDLEIITFELDLFYNSNHLVQPFDISIHGPDPSFVSLTIDDTESGNGNLRPEAGETFDIIVKVTNSGSSTCEGVVAISSLSSYLTILDSSKPSGSILPGDTITIAFSSFLSISTPESQSILFEAFLDCGPYQIKTDLGFISGGSIEDFELGHFLSFPWNTDYSTPWEITSTDSHSNIFSAISGYVTHSEESELSILLNTPVDDTIRFWYKVSSEATFDYFQFLVDNRAEVSESGDKSWSQAVVPIPKGVHTLRWKYSKDYSVSSGSDRAWIDFIQFPELSFIESDISVDTIKSPTLPSKNYSLELISVKVTNLGLDTVQSTSLTYKINDLQEVSEIFVKEILPGDTAIFEFSEVADLDQDGTYSIKVYCSSPDGYSKNDTAFVQVISTGLNDIIIDSKEFTVGPNPLTESSVLTAMSQFRKVNIELFNYQGVINWSLRRLLVLEGEPIEIPAQTLTPGIYYLRIETEQGIFLYKLIKR